MSKFQAPTDAWLLQLIGESKTPGRKIRPSRVSVTGYVATTKANKAQDAESSLEHDFLTLLEYDQRVERFLSQPFTLHWHDKQGRARHYTPDAAVKYFFRATQGNPHLRTTIFEVKPRDVLKNEWCELKPRFRSAISWAREHNCRFHIVTEREIRGDYLTNVRFLLAYRSESLGGDPVINEERREVIQNVLFKLKRTTPRELLCAITSDRNAQAMLIPWMWNLVNLQKIGVDLAQRLTMSSQIWTLEDTSWEKAE